MQLLSSDEQHLTSLFGGIRLLHPHFSAELEGSRDASSLLIKLGVLKLSADDFLRSQVVTALANAETPATEPCGNKTGDAALRLPETDAFMVGFLAFGSPSGALLVMFC